ncbi:hypothetical protein C8R47DRAFT_1134019 [Mycena vitilis]|nr:hypothetical protein C8R47DRAFT_1134019 [Mycena vitilis]
MKRTKGSDVCLPALLDVSSLVDTRQPFDVLADGRKRKRASAFSVDVISDAFEGGEERCFLKVFPPDAANTIAFKAECEANHALHLQLSKRLNEAHKDVLTGVQPLEVFKTHLQLSKQRLSWPLCYGYISVADPFFEPPRQQNRRKTGPEQKAPKLHGLLFRFYSDLALVLPDDIDEGGVMQTKILSALAPLHAAGILHRDLEERTVWPEVGFRNIFLKDGEPVILDFDHSRLMQENDRHRLAEEEAQMRELMAKAVENKGRDRGWALSKEARRLM